MNGTKSDIGRGLAMEDSESGHHQSERFNRLRCDWSNKVTVSHRSEGRNKSGDIWENDAC